MCLCVYTHMVPIDVYTHSQIRRYFCCSALQFLPCLCAYIGIANTYDQTLDSEYEALVLSPLTKMPQPKTRNRAQHHRP